ncbi:hypothetical protein N7478_012193 [Penicillium angulare]|uniref:uncharacterized protein n=1 Tax=Penicillium angulare TaxID=116970 RepID=UPI002540525C|nr:uncharacterized protein N7478_012193 [Penicillium angulare]KAJ5260588.1 hypothetical protein N7478_012193 [Penicillium angulare]
MSRRNNKVHVESFELSPRNESVITTVGRLVRAFPGPGIALDMADLDKPGLLDAIGFTLALMSHQPVAGMKPKIKKANQKHDEDRDTTDPKMITGFFMSILRPLSVDIDATQIRKHTREEVMWRDSRSPWRRSAFWLFLRVALQLILSRSSIDVRGASLYKEFMIFFLCGVLKRVPDTTPGETIFIMNAKITRRLIKLNPPSVPSWLLAVQKILRHTSNMTNLGWKEAMERSHRDLNLPSLSNLNLRRDIACDIASLDQYIDQIGQRKEKHEPRQQFHPLPRLHKYSDTEMPANLDLSDKEYSISNLAAVEEWVALNLGEWMTVHQAEEQACSQLAHLMTSYHTAAFSVGSKNPEAFSMMILTLLELWVACDKSAICSHPLLAEYDPCIPMDCFQSLLLPLKSQMERLAAIEEYLEHRQAELLYRGSGVFHDFGTSSCFSVRYFDRSPEHQQLLTTIENHASEERSQKMAELQQKQNQYRSLMDLFNHGTCEFVDVVVDKRHGIREPRHSGSCFRHSHKEKAKSIQIALHEWPLPSNLLQAKSTVFELRLPEPFGTWRDITLYFISNCLDIDYAAEERPKAQYRPQTYSGLSGFYVVPEHVRRIGLLSQSKPHQRTHRRDRPIASLAKEEVCVNNGLHFRYYDDRKECFVGTFERKLSTEKSCMYQLPQHSSALQRFLFRPAEEPHGPSPNTVIATQNLTPVNFSLGEYKSLATMPLGLEIQWQNILVELSSSAVDWKKIETALFILQIINQAGPSKKETVSRLGHAIVADEEFASALLSQISEVKEGIEENWETIHGLNSLVNMSQRVLSLSPSKTIRASCIQSLQILRQTTFRWLDAVRKKATETVDAHRKSILVGKTVHIALVCAETFNAECPSAVFLSPSDLSIFLQCSVTICNGRFRALT